MSEPFESGQRSDVQGDVAARRHGEIIAAVLALASNARADPPDRRMVEEHRLDGRLHEVDEVIVAADVCELVCQKKLDLLGRQRGEGADGEENHRP